MRKVMVIGRPERLEEFQKLVLKDCELTFFDQLNIDISQMQQEMNEMTGGTVGQEFLDLNESDLKQIDSEESDELNEEEGGDDDELTEDEIDQAFEDAEEDDPDENFGGNQIPGLELEGYSILFDLNLDENPDNLNVYAWKPGLIVFGCSVIRDLATMQDEFLGEIECTLFGINSFSGYMDRGLLEVSCLNYQDEELLKTTSASLGLEIEVVADSVGMVGPRVLAMIINEACFMLQEGTAGIPEIDQAMKLGTNYPYGPFEWADKIGIENVYLLLESLWNEHHDQRYSVSPLLKKYFLLGENFYKSQI